MKRNFIKSKLMLLPLVITIAAFTFTATYFDDTPFINQLIGKQTDVNQTYNTERVYISTDKAHYVEGETIYFSAFIREGNSLKASDKSTVVHIDILDEYNIKRLTKSFYLKEAPSASIVLPKDMKSGTYQLKAYTTWQRNDIHTLVFSKEIYVQGIADTEAKPKVIGTQATIKFYPEGGDLINGIPTNVAFTAEDEYGNPIELNAKLTGDMGTSIKLTTSTKGMGQFNIIPVKGETYTLVNNGKIITDLIGEFPAVEEDGYVLNVKKHNKKEVIISVNTNNATTGTVTLKVRDELLYAKEHTLKVGVTEIALPIADFPQGVAQITLFDGNDVEQAERLVYINKHKKLNIEVTPRKSTYLPSDSVKATIKVTDNDGKPVKGKFSLAVIDDAMHQIEAGKGSDIMSKLLLEPDLKGDVKDAAYYLSDAEGADANLDLLCMTRGWRRFEWKEVRSFQPSIMVHQYETNRVRGVLVDHKNKNPLPGKVVKLYVIGDSMVKDKSTTNALGEFSFDNLIDFRPEMGMRLLVTINGVLHTYSLDYYASSLVANERGLNDMNAIYGLGFGKVKGKLINEETQQPMSGVRLEIRRRGEYGPKYATTAADGSFSFANINSGSYTIYVPIEGKNRPKKVNFNMVNKSCYMQIAVDKRKPELASIKFGLPQKNELSNSVFAFNKIETVPTDFVERGPSVTPVTGDDWKEPPMPTKQLRDIILMIDQTQIGIVNKQDYKDLIRSPARTLDKRAETAPGVYRTPSGQLSIKGARPDGTVLLVDGVQMPIGTVIPTAGTESFEVLTTGVPARYGDFTGGAIMITTASTGTVGFDGWVDTMLMPVEYTRVRDFGEDVEEDDFEEDEKEIVNLFTDYHPTTVYWDGNVTTDENGLAEVTFANEAGFEGNFAIVVEGASVNGLLGKSVSKFTSASRMTLTISDYNVENGKLSVKVKVKNNTDVGLATSFTFVYPPELSLVSPDPKMSYIKNKEQIMWDDEVYKLNKYIKNITLDANGEVELDFVYDINDVVFDSFFAAEVSNGNNRIVKTSLLSHIKK